MTDAEYKKVVDKISAMFRKRVLIELPDKIKVACNERNMRTIINDHVAYSDTDTINVGWSMTFNVGFIRGLLASMRKKK